jgi:hypothetical protein
LSGFTEVCELHGRRYLSKRTHVSCADEELCMVGLSVWQFSFEYVTVLTETLACTWTVIYGNMLLYLVFVNNGAFPEELKPERFVQ